MNQFLVLRLANPYSWVITGADGGRLGPVATGELADAAPVAQERQVVAASVRHQQPLPVVAQGDRALGRQVRLPRAFPARCLAAERG